MFKGISFEDAEMTIRKGRKSLVNGKSFQSDTCLAFTGNLANKFDDTRHSFIGVLKVR